VVFGRPHKEIEIIDYQIGSTKNREIWTRFYGFRDGLTLDYVNELDDRMLTIWFMTKAQTITVLTRSALMDNCSTGGHPRCGTREM
jgi:hypothetical protein